MSQKLSWASILAAVLLGVLTAFILVGSPGPTRTGVVVSMSCDNGFLAVNYVYVHYADGNKTYQVRPDTCFIFQNHIGQSVTIQDDNSPLWSKSIDSYRFADGVGA